MAHFSGHGVYHGNTEALNTQLSVLCHKAGFAGFAGYAADCWR